MIEGIGISEHFPDIKDPAYLTWALAQTTLEHVVETTQAVDRMHEHCNKSMPLADRRLGPVAETAMLDLLGVSAPELESCVVGQEQVPARSDRVLLFGRYRQGNDYISLGDILGVSGYSVTVASPDTQNKQRQEYANPGITYLSKSAGELDHGDVDPGFSLAILGHDGVNLDKNEVLAQKGPKISFSGKERIQSTLRVIQPAGHLIVTSATNVRQVNRLMTDDRRFANEVTRSFDLKYVYAYGINQGNPHPIAPLAVFERR
jgi:hypothetical protein